MPANHPAATLDTHSAAQTRRLAEQVGRRLRRGDVICLYGDLGSGKTVFVQGLAKGLKVADRPTSPSFTIVHEHSGCIPLYHIDLYRLEPAQVQDVGVERYLAGDGVTVVEWAERLPRSMQARGLRVDISFGRGKNDRSLRIAPGDRRAAELLEAMSEAASRP